MPPNGDLDLIGVLAASTLGAVAGMLPWYFAGRIFGLERLRWMSDRYGRLLTMNSEEIDIAVGWFRRFGPWIVLFGRLVPLIRTLISVPAGLAQMPLLVFIAVSTVGALVWNTVLTLSGYLLHEHYEAVEGILDPASYIVLAACFLVYLYRVATWKPARPRA